jgi:hypothetical protein
VNFLAVGVSRGEIKTHLYGTFAVDNVARRLRCNCAVNSGGYEISSKGFRSQPHWGCIETKRSRRSDLGPAPTPNVVSAIFFCAKNDTFAIAVAVFFARIYTVCGVFLGQSVTGTFLAVSTMRIPIRESILTHLEAGNRRVQKWSNYMDCFGWL